MTKEEFLNTLGTKLSEDLSESEIASEIRYYEGYIDAAVAKGRSEEEATEELGDPILIARNIAESPRGGYGYREASYEQGYEEATYQQLKTSAGGEDSPVREVEAEEYVPDYGFNDDGAGGAGPVYKEKTNTTFDNGFFERGPKQEIEKTGGISALFRNVDGSFNWGCLTTLLIVVLVVGVIIALVTKVVIAAWPVILVAIVFGIVFSFFKGQS